MRVSLKASSPRAKMAAEFVLTAIKKNFWRARREGGAAAAFSDLSAVCSAWDTRRATHRRPGGPKEDIIPAMLSAGEFVMSADAVKALGTANSRRSTSPRNRPRFPPRATSFCGGPATRARVDDHSEISMGIGLDEGLILGTWL